MRRVTQTCNWAEIALKEMSGEVAKQRKERRNSEWDVDNGRKNGALQVFAGHVESMEEERLGSKRRRAVTTEGKSAEEAK